MIVGEIIIFRFIVATRLQNPLRRRAAVKPARLPIVDTTSPPLIPPNRTHYYIFAYTSRALSPNAVGPSVTRRARPQARRYRESSAARHADVQFGRFKSKSRPRRRLLLTTSARGYINRHRRTHIMCTRAAVGQANDDWESKDTSNGSNVKKIKTS